MSAPASQLARQLGPWDAGAIFVGIILGSGIFVAPSAVAAAAPSFGAAALLWAAGAVVALCGALTYAECAARLPVTGGFYVFYRDALGKPFAFVGGWAALLITYPASVAAIAVLCAFYLTELVPALAGHTALVAAAVLLLSGLLNAAGVRTSANAQRLLTGAKVAALLLLCVAAILFGRSGSVSELPPPTAEGLSFSTLVGAIMVLLWTYDGWSDVTLVAGELKNPSRDLVRAVLFGTAALFVVYLAVQLAVVTLLPPTQAAASERVLAQAVAVGLGPTAGRLVALLVVVATFGSVNAVVLSASRLGFAMAQDGTFLRWFGRVQPRFGTPARAVWFLIVISVAYALAAQFRDLVAFFSFSVWLFYAATAIALFRLRSRGVGEPLRWPLKSSPVAPVLLLITAVALTAGLAAQNPKNAGLALALLAAGFPIYGLWMRAVSRRA